MGLEAQNFWLFRSWQQRRHFERLELLYRSLLAVASVRHEFQSLYFHHLKSILDHYFNVCSNFRATVKCINKELILSRYDGLLHGYG